MSLGLKMKDPDAVLDYEIDWSDWLTDGETILTSTWSIDSSDLAKKVATHDGTTTTIWLTGGTEGTAVRVENHVVTSEDREDDRSFVIQLKEK